MEELFLFFVGAVMGSIGTLIIILTVLPRRINGRNQNRPEETENSRDGNNG